MDRYEPIRILGEGSFGKVYLMRDKVKKSLVCIKIIKIKNIPKKEREATKMEVDLLRRLHHPNIVRYIDSFLMKNNESLCICMEYCDGGDLASQVKAARRNLFSESKVLHWFVQIALGLHYMHNNRVLHRDLKTQNIFLLGNGRLVLGDLGISKVLDGTMDFAQTCIGTPYYMSPEIFKNKPYSYKSDVWALGCVLYEMTTLTHAFDANSLNGLAGKIIKGRYPPIHHKYSKFLRDLISDMLMTNPQQRPDMDQILRRPFIKKHIVNFFSDVMSRPSGSIGEGTMIVRAAVGGSAPMSINSDNNMLAFKQQLQQLEMMDAVAEALSPKAVPTDYNEAKKLAREQMSALKREEEHKKLVESALEKLRIERENKSKERALLAAKQPRGSQREQRPAVVARPQPAAYMPRPTPEQGRDAVREGGLNWGRRDGSVADSNAAMIRDRERIEREKRQAEEVKRRQLILEQEARDRAEEKRREEARIREDEAKLREEARLRDETRAREDAVNKQKQDQLRAQADVAAKRDLLRQRERERQQEEIEQLKRDKLELDRRAVERERIRNELRENERKRLESVRKEKMESVQEKLSVMQDQINRFEPALNRAEEKDVSQRDKVLLRKQEKQAREENERLEALREAEAQNRRLRMQANQKSYNLYHNNSGATPPAAGAVKRYSSDEERAHEYDVANRDSKARPSMDNDELTKRLQEVSSGSRYDDSGQRPPARAGPNLFRDDGEMSDETASNGDEVENWQVSDPDELVEALHQREEELQAELKMSTMRMEEMKKTLQETKTILGSKHNILETGPAKAGVGKAIVSAPVLESDDEDYYYDDDYVFDETGELEDENWTVPKSGKVKEAQVDKSEAVTPRRDRAPVAVQKNSPYENLQDGPTPSGRLGDRIRQLRQQCINALGKEPFASAYDFLRQNQVDSDRGLYEDDHEDKVVILRNILGEEKIQFSTLIEQLIFMEEYEN